MMYVHITYCRHYFDLMAARRWIQLANGGDGIAKREVYSALLSHMLISILLCFALLRLALLCSPSFYTVCGAVLIDSQCGICLRIQKLLMICVLYICMKVYHTRKVLFG